MYPLGVRQPGQASFLALCCSLTMQSSFLALCCPLTMLYLPTL